MSGHSGFDVKDLEAKGLKLVFGKNGPILQKIVKEEKNIKKTMVKRYNNTHGLIGLGVIICILLALYYGFKLL
jgi:hypothetical protein